MSVLHLIQMFYFKFCIYVGSKFAPYGKDGCAGIKPEDQSDNSAMSTTGRRRGNMVNRVNSTDNQCFFEGSSHFQFEKGQKISKANYGLLDSCKNMNETHYP
jgi:hypothetical protein